MSWMISKALMDSFENSRSSQVQAAGFSAESCSAGEPSAQLSVMPTLHKFSRNDKTMDASTLSRFGLTCAVLTESRGEELLTWFRAGFPARTSQRPEKAQESTVKDQDFGAKWQGLLAKYDRDMSLWKTAQCSLLADLDVFSGTWPRWGTMRNGACWARATPEHHTNGSESGLWASPTCMDAKPIKGGDLYQTASGTIRARNADGSSSNRGLAVQVTWPTPVSSEGRDCGSQWDALAKLDKGGRIQRRIATLGMPETQQNKKAALNPTWVELLMGWPSKWTCLDPISHVEYARWIVGFTDDDEKTRSKEVLRMLRRGVISQEVSRAIGRSIGLSETAILLAFVCKHEGRLDQSRVFMACAETLEGQMRVLRQHQDVSGAPHRSESPEQRLGEHSDVVQDLSRLLAQYGSAAWRDGSWENATPRVIDMCPFRLDRLTAIGNGQVPSVAALAWRILGGPA